MGLVTTAEVAYRSPIKQPLGHPPSLAIIVPVGVKERKYSFPVPDCEREGCSCPNHGKTAHTGVLSSLMVPFHWALNVPNVLIPINVQAFFLAQSGTLSAEARNEMTKKAIGMGAKYAFFWDDDVILPPLTFYTMHTILERNPDIGLVTGVYVTREDPSVPLLFKEHFTGPYWDFSLSPDDPPEDIWAAGAGCIMARLSDVQKMEEPYWADEQFVDSTGHSTVWGHDIRFFKNFREASGKRTVVQGSLLCKHWDAEKGKFYELPEDSAPYRRRQVPTASRSELCHYERLDPDGVWKLLRDTEGDQRIFLVSKGQSQEEISEVLQGYFSAVQILSVEKDWLAVCEGMKNGNGSQGSADPDQRGDVRGGSCGHQAGERRCLGSIKNGGGLDPAPPASPHQR